MAFIAQVRQPKSSVWNELTLLGWMWKTMKNSYKHRWRFSTLLGLCYIEVMAGGWCVCGQWAVMFAWQFLDTRLETQHQQLVRTCFYSCSIATSIYAVWPVSTILKFRNCSVLSQPLAVCTKDSNIRVVVHVYRPTDRVGMFCITGLLRKNPQDLAATLKQGCSKSPSEASRLATTKLGRVYWSCWLQEN